MRAIIAAGAALLPLIAAADDNAQPARAAMIETPVTAGPPKVDKAVARFVAARELVENDQWLADIAHDAATAGRRKTTKLPDGVVVTVVRVASLVDNPFADVLTGGAKPPGASMKPVTYKVADGKRGKMRAIMWVDERKIDYKRLQK